MGKYPFTTVPSKIKPALDSIRSSAVPQRVTVEWLKTVGMTSSNDRTILPVLKFLGFIDESGEPTRLWREYQSEKPEGVLGRAIIDAYSDVFRHFPAANLRSKDELRRYFARKSDASPHTIDKTVSTFKTLCRWAEFDGSVDPNAAAQGPADEYIKAAAAFGILGSNGHSSGMNMNITLQIQLPGRADVGYFEELFTAIRKHLLTDPHEGG